MSETTVVRDELRNNTWMKNNIKICILWIIKCWCFKQNIFVKKLGNWFGLESICEHEVWEHIQVQILNVQRVTARFWIHKTKKLEKIGLEHEFCVPVKNWIGLSIHKHECKSND